MAPSFSNHLWTQDSPICPSDCGDKLGPYTDQGRSTTRVCFFKSFERMCVHMYTYVYIYIYTHISCQSFYRDCQVSKTLSLFGAFLIRVGWISLSVLSYRVLPCPVLSCCPPPKDLINQS